MIQENLAQVQQTIHEACALANRANDAVTLVAVTKTVDAKVTESLIRLGQLHCAENRVDKFLAKKVALQAYPEVRWHFIGNLQRRKVKDVINEIDYFHALDSLRLADEIQKRAEKVIKCFVEVNVSGEESKHGISPEEVEHFIRSLAEYTQIQVIGLMTMAPFESTEQEQREIFKKLHLIQKQIANLKFKHAPCLELSMGMSNDYPIAISQGATYVRVGTALFR